jgi:hypothetical protein
MAKVMANKWDYICKSYYQRGLHSFKEDKMIPVVYLDEGDYLTYYYGSDKEKGIYFFDEKVTDTYIEMIKRLAIHPNYYINIKDRVNKDDFEFKDFNKDSKYLMDYLVNSY